MKRIYILAACQSKAYNAKRKMKAFFSEQKFTEALQACAKREDIYYRGIECEIQQDDVLELVPYRWYSRGVRPYRIDQIEQTLCDIARWKFGKSASFIETEEFKYACVRG